MTWNNSYFRRLCFSVSGLKEKTKKEKLIIQLTKIRGENIPKKSSSSEKILKKLSKNFQKQSTKNFLDKFLNSKNVSKKSRKNFSHRKIF